MYHNVPQRIKLSIDHDDRGLNELPVFLEKNDRTRIHVETNFVGFKGMKIYLSALKKTGYGLREEKIVGEVDVRNLRYKSKYKETFVLTPCPLKSGKNKDVLIFTVELIFENGHKATFMGQYFYMFSKNVVHIPCHPEFKRKNVLHNEMTREYMICQEPWWKLQTQVMNVPPVFTPPFPEPQFSMPHARARMTKVGTAQVINPSPVNFIPSFPIYPSSVQVPQAEQYVVDAVQYIAKNLMNQQSKYTGIEKRNKKMHMNKRISTQTCEISQQMEQMELGWMEDGFNDQLEQEIDLESLLKYDDEKGMESNLELSWLPEGEAHLMSMEESLSSCTYSEEHQVAFQVDSDLDCDKLLNTIIENHQDYYLNFLV